MHINLIGTQFIFPVQIRQEFIERSFETCSVDACGYVTAISSPIESFFGCYGAYFAHRKGACRWGSKG